jgi:hypothetical protein
MRPNRTRTVQIHRHPTNASVDPTCAICSEQRNPEAHDAATVQPDGPGLSFSILNEQFRHGGLLLSAHGKHYVVVVRALLFNAKMATSELEHCRLAISLRAPW